jgi:hypothetical protein
VEKPDGKRIEKQTPCFPTRFPQVFHILPTETFKNNNNFLKDF